MPVREACAKAGSGPERIGNEKRKYYNTINCGNQPYNDAWDETACPGRVDLGKGNTSGCKETGPSLVVQQFSQQAASAQAPEKPKQASPNPPAKSQPEPPTPAPKKPEQSAPMAADQPMPKNPGPSANSRITAIKIVDVYSKAATYLAMDGNSKFSASTYPGGFTVEAVVNGNVEKVVFDDNGVTKTERVAPFVLSGNEGPNYRKWSAKVGETHTVRVTAVMSSGATESKVATVQIV